MIAVGTVVSIGHKVPCDGRDQGPENITEMFRPLLRDQSLHCPNSPLTDLQRVRRRRSKRGRSQRGEESRNKSQSQAECNWDEL